MAATRAAFGIRFQLFLLVSSLPLAFCGPERGRCKAETRSCSLADAPRPPTGGLALLQARADRLQVTEVSPVRVALEVDTSEDPYAGTETGAAVAFLTNGSWTADQVLCRRTKLNETVLKTYDLEAWPTKLRITALGQDAWGYSKIVLRWDKYVITVLDSFIGNNTYGNGSVHWVDSDEEAPARNTYLVSELPLHDTAKPPKAKHHNATNQSEMNNSDVGAEAERNCTTRYDPRASSIGYTTSPPGTPCVFGLDPRDEGSHCILDDGAYGTFGWCYTNADGSSFGSCSMKCPLFGPLEVLGDKIDELREELRHRDDEPVVEQNESADTSKAGKAGKADHAKKAVVTHKAKKGRGNDSQDGGAAGGRHQPANASIADNASNASGASNATSAGNASSGAGSQPAGKASKSTHK